MSKMKSVKSWWARWREVAIRLITHTASFASLIGLVIAFFPSNADIIWWQIILLFVASLAFLTFIILEFNSTRNHHVFNIEDKSDIREYMHDWIKSGGRVVIWTRDMSWAQNDETTELLYQKAENGELGICLPESIPLTNELEKRGADIWIYGSEMDAPSSRFTIRFFGRDGKSVAVGRADGKLHLIDEFNSKDHPAFYIAEDLVNLARHVSNNE